MGSTSPPAASPAIPTISIAPFLSPSTSPAEHLSATSQSLSCACRSPGFFYLTNHNLPPALTSRVLSLARDFFTTVPQSEKEKIKRRGVGDGHGDGARGYQVIGENVTEGKGDWHEGIDWYRPILPGESFDECIGKGARKPPYDLIQGLNQWPSGPSGFREVYEEYIRLMLALGTAVVRAMGVALKEEGVLGDEETFVKQTAESFWVLRAIGYPQLPVQEQEEGKVSCGAHTDYGCVTLLLADETKGALQVWLENEGEEGRWLDVDPVPGALVVNIGDMMERWSGGRWKSTRHRVVHRRGGFRVSVPFFFEPDFAARVPGKEGEGEVVYGEYLMGKVKGNF